MAVWGFSTGDLGRSDLLLQVSSIGSPHYQDKRRRQKVFGCIYEIARRNILLLSEQTDFFVSSCLVWYHHPFGSKFMPARPSRPALGGGGGLQIKCAGHMLHSMLEADGRCR